MRDFSGAVRDPLSLTESAFITGMIEGNLTVPSGLTLDLRGMVTGNLLIEQGGRATVRGMVNGTIHNSGTLDLYGMAGGLVTIPPGESRVDAAAVVAGRRGG